MLLKTILIIGKGSIGEKHRLVAEKHRLVQRVVCVSHRAFIDATKDCSLLDVNDYLTSIVGTLPDAAVIAGPASDHIDVAQLLLAADVPMIVEKPLSDSVEHAQQFSHKLAQCDVPVCVGYNLRYSRSLNCFKEQIDSHLLGAIYSLRSEVGQYLPDWRPQTDYRQSVSATASLGGGVLLELSHEIDYLQWIFGRVDRVIGIVDTVSQLDVDVEDSADVLMSFEGGSVCHAITASLHMDFCRRDTVRRCTVTGEQGTLIWDGVANTVSHYTVQHSEWQVIFNDISSKYETYELAFDSFMQRIDTNATHAALASVEQATSVLAVIEAIRKSSSSRQSEHVEHEGAP